MAIIGRVPGATVEFRPRAIGIYMGKKLGGLVIGFDGAQSVAPKGVDLEQSQTNYLLGNSPALWRTHIPNYAKVTYSGLYRGVDAVFYGNGTHLEHDFVVKPGADYRKIRMHFPSNSRIQLEKDGTLTMEFAGASLRMEAPSIYQNLNGKRQQRHGAFRVQADNDVGFTVANYDPRFDLIIDPVLDFSTYLSPLGADGLAIATDANGDSYVTGYGTLGYPVTSGAFSSCSGCITDNVITFISKLSADGSSLIYSTVLGGNSFAQPTGIAVDANGDAIVSGWTGASNFPTKSGQAILPQNNNYVGFLVSLAPDGSSLNYGTLLGSSPAATRTSMTYATAVAVDSAGNAYVSGETGDGFFVSSGALNQANSNTNGNYNNFDIFLAKFSSSGALVYSAVLGTADPQNPGGGPIGASAIAVDTAGDAYVTGQAGSLWPISSGAYLSQIAGSAQPYAYAAPFVMKVAPDAKSVIYSTYLDYAYAMAGISVLPNGDVFVVGNQAGATYPTTSNAYEPNSGNDAPFLTELNANGSALVYSTVVCPEACTVNGMAIDSGGNIWLASQTSNVQLPLEMPLQSIMPLGSTSYAGPVSLLSEFDPTGQTLVFQTFLGGMAAGYASSVAVDPNSRVHVSGAAEYGMYTTAGVYAGSVPEPDTLSTYTYVALVDPAVAAAGLCINPNVELTFATPLASDGRVTITSCGAEPLSITDVTTSSGDFSVPASEDGCLQTLPVGQSCTLSVRFTPSVAGAESATLSIASNSPIPAVLHLSGTAPQSQFTIGTQAGASTTSTVSAGSTATYALMISSAAGYSGNINLSCNNLPANASCMFAPTSFAIRDGAPASFTLSISTESNQTASLLRTGGLGAALAGFLFLVPLNRNRKRAAALICFGALVLTAGISACGGGSSAATGTTNPQTAKVSPGTYTVQVVASDISGNQVAQSITLIVQ